MKSLCLIIAQIHFGIGMWEHLFFPAMKLLFLYLGEIIRHLNEL